MKQEIHALVDAALQQLVEEAVLPADHAFDVQLERCRDKAHGDYACNIAMMLAKVAKMAPRQLAEKLLAAMPGSDHIAKVDIAGPGFINFTLSEAAQSNIIEQVLSQGAEFGRSQVGQGEKILLEFVSANPTGPLHVGHGRGAAFGASLASLLSAAGYQVHKEYYVNDAGRQMDILATSVWLRYLACFDYEFPFPSNAYKGDYVIDIAKALKAEYGDQFVKAQAAIFSQLPADEPDGGDKELYIDALIERARDLLGKADYELVHAYGLNQILADIREDLADFSVTFDEWYSERSLTSSHAVERAIEKLQAAGHTYEKEGAIWFNAIHFGDEKDRVLVRANGQSTYFASDVAYHMNKFERGHDRLIDILGADHHGYVTRVKASIEAMGGDPSHLDVNLVQFAILYRGEERVQMSTRSGSFVTLRELREDVGNDAARFFYVMRKPEQHMDFDLELAKSQSSDNPVYYIQYAHARVCSVERQLQERNIEIDRAKGLAALHLLSETHETSLMQSLSRYPELIESAALSREPHQIAHYMRDLANHFHTYYNAHHFIVEDDALCQARLCLVAAVKQVLQNGLRILGVSAPESM